MAHTYVIGQIKYPINQAGDPWLTVPGTVDGTAVIGGCFLSVYLANGANAIAAQNFVISLLLAAWTALQTGPPVNAPPNGTTITV
jgi:hypothetical protein